MKEISIYHYTQTKNILIDSVSLDVNNRVSFSKLTNVYIQPKLWSVITGDFFIFSDFERYLSSFKHQKIILNRHEEIKKYSKTIQKNTGNYFLFGGENNYWHFLIDFMPRLFCLNYITNKDIQIIIAADLDKKYLEFIINYCKLIKLDKLNFIKINRDNLIYFFENLIFTSRPSISFDYVFYNKFIGNSYLKKRIRNLYVKRGNTINRRVLNENELIKFLQKYNYEIIDCVEMKIEEQIKVFSQAKNIIIPSGAAMANLLFVPDNINVVEIRSNLDGDFSKKINFNSRFYLYLFEETKKVGLKLRKDIVVNLLALKNLIEGNKIF